MTYFQDDPLDINTPENVHFAYDIAGIGSRFLAALVDTLIIVIFEIAFWLLMVSLAYNLLAEVLDGDLVSWAIAVFTLISFLMLWGYYIFFEMAWDGQSPGKRWVAIRVIRVDGTPITLSESLIRNIVRLIDFLPINYAVGVITMFINKQSRRLGDLAAGTLVVRDYQKSIAAKSLEAKQAAPAPTDSTPPFIEGVGLLALEKLNDTDIYLAKEFLARSQQQANLSDLGINILRTLLKKMELPIEQIYTPYVNKTLKQIVEFYEHRRE